MSWLRRAWDHDLAWSFRHSPVALAAAALTALCLGGALFAPWIAPHDPFDSATLNLSDGFTPPAWSEKGTTKYLLGTDDQGRDILSAVLYGSRVSLLVGFASVLFSMVLGVTLGLISGYAGGRVDSFIMRIADVQLSFPFILLAMTINAIVGLGLQNIILSLSAAGWVVYARVVRGEVLSVKQREFVQAASALGIGRTRLILRHILPNVAPSIIVVASLQFSQFIVAEAAISFLGFGVQPPTPAWGSMLSESRDFLYIAWWLAAFPGAALALTALGVNLLGDWLRDTLDPKLRV